MVHALESVFFPAFKTDEDKRVLKKKQLLGVDAAWHEPVFWCY